MTRRTQTDKGPIEIGPLTVDQVAKRAYVNGELVALTGKEYEVLEYLAVRRGTTITKDMFLKHLYPPGDEPEIKIIDVFVCKIRRKLKKFTGGDPLIDTVWGRGYVLLEPEKRPANVVDTPKLAAGS